MISRAPLAIAAIVCLVLAQPATGQRFSRKDADTFKTKLARIVENGQTPVGRAVPRTVQVTDAEVNAYLRYHAKDEIPVGIVEPTLAAVGDGRVSGRAIVDLDAVRKQKERGWLDPLAYLTGQLPITAVGRLTSKDGIGRFELESAEISGVRVPKTVIQELLTHYSRTPEQPKGINMDDPFELPSRIREIRVGRAAATIVQ